MLFHKAGPGKPAAHGLVLFSGPDLPLDLRLFGVQDFFGAAKKNAGLKGHSGLKAMPEILIIDVSDAGISVALYVLEVKPDTDVAVLCAAEYPDFSIRGLPFHIPDKLVLENSLQDLVSCIG